MMHRLIIVAAVAVITVAAEQKPLITAEIITSTVELISDISEAAYDATLAELVSKLSPQAIEHVNKGVDFIASKANKKPDEIWSQVAEVKAMVAQGKADVAAKLAGVHEKLNLQASILVSKFDAAVPKYAGRIPKTVGDLSVFTSYILFVLYVTFFFVRKLVAFKLRIFCFFCCCGCCRGGKAASTTAKAKSGAPSKGEKAASKSKGKK